MSLYKNINKRKKAGTSRSKSKSTISKESYANMKAGFPKKAKGGVVKGSKKDLKNIVGELKKENFINEERFARAFCHDKFLLNKWGKRRISTEIRKYDLPKMVIAQGLAYINQKEYHTTLADLADIKWNKLNEPDLLKKKQKTVNYLLQKGYESDLIWEVVQEMKT